MKRPSFFKKRQVLLPTWPTVFAGLLGCGGLVVWAVLSIHSYLAVTRPVEGADVLVVEGWLADYNLGAVVEDYRKGSYQIVGATGIPLDQGSYLMEYKNYGEVTASSLKKLGLRDGDLLVAPSPRTYRHRTYHAAKAMKEALAGSGRQFDAINLVSQTVHARRSRIVFQKVFGDSVKVGIVALPNENYDNERWWGSSAGIKTVGMEIIAFVHEWLFDSGRSENE